MITILQYTHVSNHHFVHLQPAQRYMPIISQQRRKERKGAITEPGKLESRLETPVKLLWRLKRHVAQSGVQTDRRTGGLRQTCLHWGQGRDMEGYHLSPIILI